MKPLRKTNGTPIPATYRPQLAVHKTISLFGRVPGTDSVSAHRRRTVGVISTIKGQRVYIWKELVVGQVVYSNAKEVDQRAEPDYLAIAKLDL